MKLTRAVPLVGYPKMTGVVSYLRVSTGKQGKTGLGLERSARRSHGSPRLTALEVVGEHVDIETGKGADALKRRPMLRKALELARKRRCSIAVAKLDRLSRDVAFIAGLMSVASSPSSGRTSIRSCCTFMRRWPRRSGR
jgi:DNA invertase Pin-like site-specific DNA recombinase